MKTSGSLTPMLFATTGILLTAVTMAQTPAEPKGQAQLEEVVVTAQRREESVQKAAVAISVLDAEAIKSAAVTRPDQLTLLSPALQSTLATGNGASFYVRGVGSPVLSQVSDPAVAFNYDGVYISRPTSTSGLFYDLQRIEVLKGQQGTLYGRNATGGAINVLPAHPSLQGTSGYVNLSTGNYDTVNFEGALNLPVTATSALRLSGQYLENSGYNEDGSDSQRGYGGRLQYLWEPADTLSLRLGSDYYHGGGSGAGGKYTASISNADFFAFLAGATPQLHFTPTGFANDVGANDPRATALLQTLYNPLAGRNLDALQTRPRLDDDFWGVNAELNWSSSLGTLTVIPAYRHAKLDEVSVSPGFIGIIDETDKQKSLEARFASSDEGMLRWLVGAYWFDESIDADSAYNQRVLLAPMPTQIDTTSTAGFARLTFAPIESLRFVGGVRYSKEKKKIDAVGQVMVDVCTVGTPPSCPAAPLVPSSAHSEADVVSQLGLVAIPNPAPGRLYILPSSPGTIFSVQDQVLVDSRTDNKWTWRGAVDYDLTPTSLLYASVETGYHAGGFSFTTDSRRTFAPETITAYTLGSKNRLFDDRLQLNVEVFLWKYKDQQVPHFVLDANSGNTVFVTENIGRSTNQGVELEAQYLLTPSTLLGADVQYLDSSYDSFIYSNAGLAITGCNVIGPRNDPAGQSLIDCSGRQAVRSPKWTLNLNAQQTFELGDTRLTLAANTRYESESAGQIDYIPETTLPSNWNTNAFVKLEFGAQQHYFATAYVNNIENDRIYYAGVSSLLHFVAGPASKPRLYGLRLGMDF